MAMGFQRNSNRPRGREVAAHQLEEFMLSGADASRDWTQPPSRHTGRERDIHELIAEYGGTHAVAQATGRSQRQIQRWARSGTDRMSPESRRALTRASDRLNAADRRAHGRAEWGALAQRFGGAKGLAQALGVHHRTAQKWLSGAAVPSEANLARLKQADRGYRLSQTYGHLGSQAADPAPAGRVHMKASGDVRARGVHGSPVYDYQRQLGIASVDDRGHELPPEVSQDLFQAMQTDPHQALDVLQEHLSGARDGDPWGYANCGAYDPDQEWGFFLDNFSDFHLA